LALSAFEKGPNSQPVMPVSFLVVDGSLLQAIRQAEKISKEMERIESSLLLLKIKQATYSSLFEKISQSQKDHPRIHVSFYEDGSAGDDFYSDHHPCPGDQ
jgi:hypothetical protein